MCLIVGSPRKAKGRRSDTTREERKTLPPFFFSLPLRDSARLITTQSKKKGEEGREGGLFLLLCSTFLLPTPTATTTNSQLASSSSPSSFYVGCGVGIKIFFFFSFSFISRCLLDLSLSRRRRGFLSVNCPPLFLKARLLLPLD